MTPHQVAVWRELLRPIRCRAARRLQAMRASRRRTRRGGMSSCSMSYLLILAERNGYGPTC